MTERHRGLPTVLLFVALGLFVEGQREQALLWHSVSAFLLTLVFLHEDNQHFIDIRKQRELIAQAQGKQNGTRN